MLKTHQPSANLRLVKGLFSQKFLQITVAFRKKQTFNEKYNNILRKYACKDVLHAHVAGNY